jgi:hypothetical protein
VASGAASGEVSDAVPDAVPDAVSGGAFGTVPDAPAESGGAGPSPSGGSGAGPDGAGGAAYDDPFAGTPEPASPFGSDDSRTAAFANPYATAPDFAFGAPADVPAGPTEIRPPYPPGPGAPPDVTGTASAHVPAPAAAPGWTAPAAPAATPAVRYVGDRPPTYDAEPTALPQADPDELAELVADTVLDGARHGSCTLRAASVRGDSARYRGEPRRDALLTARFGTGEQALVLIAMATGARATAGAHRAAAEACQEIGRFVGRHHASLAEDMRAGLRGPLKAGLHRLTDRCLGRLRARARQMGVGPEEYTATLRCLLLPADPECRLRIFFGVGPGGLFRVRHGVWQDIEPYPPDASAGALPDHGPLPAESPAGDRLTMDLGLPEPPSSWGYDPGHREPDPHAAGAEPEAEPSRPPFRFRAASAAEGDILLLCSPGLAEPLLGEPALAAHLTARWTHAGPPGLAEFLADTQVRVKGYADDRTAAAVWEI